MRKAVLLSFVVCGFLTSPTYSAVEYEVTDLTELWQESESFLGSSASNTQWFANALNDRGQVVGSVGNFISYDGLRYAILWDEDNGLREIGNLGRANSIATGINNNGQVVGSSDGHGFLWSDSGGMISLGLLPQGTFLIGSTCAHDINEQGCVVGVSNSITMFHEDAFVWSPTEGMQPVAKFNSDFFSCANAINNNGQVVGYENNIIHFPGFVRKAFLWNQDSGTQLLPLIGDDDTLENSEANDINDWGEVVGVIHFLDPSSQLAVLWRNGVAHDLGNLGESYSSANAINENSVIVGYSNTPDAVGIPASHAFIWDEERGMCDLNELIDPTLAIELVDAIDINNNGWILANARDGRVYLLKPVPEPGLTIFILTAAIHLLFLLCVRVLRVYC